MTNEIEMTKRVMYLKFGIVKDLAEDAGASPCIAMREFEDSLDAHLEELRKSMQAMNDLSVRFAQGSADTLLAQDKRICAMTEERDSLRNRVQVLESANQIAGERLRTISGAREASGAISHQDKSPNSSCAPLDAKTAAILGAVVDVQRIVTDWATKGLKAKEAMRLVAGVVNGNSCYSAMLAFEKPAKPEITGASIAHKFSSRRTLADVAIDKALKDLMVTGMGAYQMTVGENGIDVTTLSADELMRGDRSFTKESDYCQHEFHPKFPSGEMCTYCGVVK